MSQTVSAQAAPMTDSLDVFFPGDIIQGLEFPGHILSKSSVERVILQLPEGMEFVEAFNAESTQRKGQVTLRPSVHPSYVGLVLSSDRLEQTIVDRVIEGEVHHATGEVQAFSRTVTMFRPQVTPRLPKGNLEARRSGDSIVMGNRIRLVNEGHGTSVVTLTTPSTSPIQVETSSAIAEFQRGFLSDLTSRLPGLGADHPRHTKLLNASRDAFNFEGFGNLERRAKKLDEFLEKLIVAMASDEDLQRDVESIFAQAFRTNWKLVTLVDDFIEFIATLQSRRIIFYNPLDIVRVSSGRNRVEFELHQMDLGANEYPSMPIKVEISAPYDLEIPIHALFHSEEAG